MTIAVCMLSRPGPSQFLLTCSHERAQQYSSIRKKQEAGKDDATLVPMAPCRYQHLMPRHKCTGDD
jgi:hypothetical protein